MSQPTVFVRLSGPNEELDSALGALERAGYRIAFLMLGDDESAPWIEIEHPGTSGTAESVRRRVEAVLSRSGVGFEVRDYGSKPRSTDPP